MNFNHFVKEISLICIINILNLFAMRKIMYKVLIVASIFTMMACSDDLLVDNGNVDRSQISTEEQLSALDIGKNLIESFKASPSRSSTDLVYPDYYAGTYIQEDGNLVVLIKGDHSKYRNAIIQRAKSNNFILKEGLFSMNELLTTLDVLKVFMFDENNKSTLKELGLECCGLLSHVNV